MHFEAVCRTPQSENHFFGYYDKSPLSQCENALLSQRAPFINRMPKAGEELEIGYFDFPELRGFTVIGATRAWNWQQGCMLQWLGPDFSSKLLFNDIRDGSYRTVIHERSSGAETVLPLPSYTVTSDGRTAFCVDYDRLFWFRPGYNYQGPPRADKNVEYDPEDGIWRMSLENGQIERIISLEDLFERADDPLKQMGAHYVEHLMLSPDDRRLAFLHRILSPDGGIFARLFVANSDGSDLRLLNASGRMSHFCWRGNDTLFGYGGAPTTFNSLRRSPALARYFVRPLLPVYHLLFPVGGAVSRRVTGDSFQFFYLSGRTSRISRELLPEDGHPTFKPDNPDVIVCDTYPDETGDCQLYLFDVERAEYLDRTVVKSDPKVRATGFRSDLHPKWSRDGNHVAIDVCDEGGRFVQVFAIR